MLPCETQTRFYIQVREQLGIMKVATAGGGADKPIDKQDDSAGTGCH
jgi:hypothetical protein